jgi:hypothetical protein
VESWTVLIVQENTINRSAIFSNGQAKVTMAFGKGLVFISRVFNNYISIATNTGWVFNTRFLLYLIHNCVVLHTNKRYCAQCAHSDAARESRYIITRSIQESWIVVKFVTLF